VTRACAAALLLACAALSGCSAVRPPPLAMDVRWKELLRDGRLPETATVYVAPPRLERPAGLELNEGVTFDPPNKSWYWPELPPELNAELRFILSKNSGYRVVLWDPAAPDAAPPPECDYELRLTVTRYRLELLEVGTGSALAAMWLWAMPQLATFYAAPDEVYHCDYRAVATLRPVRGDREPHSRTLRGAKQLTLTDFQRGWSLYSYWPEQGLNWLGGEDSVSAWRAYGPHVARACEPHARRALLIELMAFLRATATSRSSR
jgi:hypothetical protein